MCSKFCFSVMSHLVITVIAFYSQTPHLAFFSLILKFTNICDARFFKKKWTRAHILSQFISFFFFIGYGGTLGQVEKLTLT